jgi:hypothetical protein
VTGISPFLFLEPPMRENRKDEAMTKDIEERQKKKFKH